MNLARNVLGLLGVSTLKKKAGWENPTIQRRGRYEHEDSPCADAVITHRDRCTRQRRLPMDRPEHGEIHRNVHTSALSGSRTASRRANTQRQRH